MCDANSLQIQGQDLKEVMFDGLSFMVSWETRLSSENQTGRWGEPKLRAKPNEALVIVTHLGLGLTLRNVKLFFSFLHLFSMT